VIFQWLGGLLLTRRLEFRSEYHGIAKLKAKYFVVNIENHGSFGYDLKKEVPCRCRLAIRRCIYGSSPSNFEVSN
jgi:hypothetical protein